MSLFNENTPVTTDVKSVISIAAFVIAGTIWCTKTTIQMSGLQDQVAAMRTDIVEIKQHLGIQVSKNP